MVKSIFLVIFALLIGCSTIRNSRSLRYSSQPVLRQSCLELRQVINSWIGTPYLYGGDNQNGVDCSGFVQQIYRSAYQIDLPRTTVDLYNLGQRIRENQIRCGDLVFFKNQRGRSVDHVGIYIEGDQFVHASSTQGVVISDMNEEYYRQRFMGVRRLLLSE